MGGEEYLLDYKKVSDGEVLLHLEKRRFTENDESVSPRYIATVFDMKITYTLLKKRISELRQQIGVLQEADNKLW